MSKPMRDHVVALLGVLLLAAAVRAQEPTPEPPVVTEEGPFAVIPPGQEELLGEMVGRGSELPGGCTLTAGRIEQAAVSATYACRDGEVVIELVHPHVAGRGATRTERFAVQAARGTPPEGLVAAIADRVRAREQVFEWKVLGPPPRFAAGWLAPIGAAAVGALLLVVFWRRRRAPS